MVKFVLKRSGTKVPFDAEKIKSSVSAAAKDAEFPEEKISDLSQKISSLIVDELAETQEVSTLEIRDRTLDMLNKEAPEVAEAWKKYDQSMGK